MAFRTESSEDQRQPQAMRASGDERRFTRRIDCDTRRDSGTGYPGRGGGSREASAWESSRLPRI